MRIRHTRSLPACMGPVHLTPGAHLSLMESFEKDHVRIHFVSDPMRPVWQNGRGKEEERSRGKIRRERENTSNRLYIHTCEEQNYQLTDNNSCPYKCFSYLCHCWTSDSDLCADGLYCVTFYTQQDTNKRLL